MSTERGAGSALLVGHDWGGTIAWSTAMKHPEVVDRLAILNAAHPRKLSQGLHHPGQLRKSWYFYFFFLDLPELPESAVHADHWRFFRHFLGDAHPAYAPEEIDRYVEAWSQPGAATGVINYYRSSVRTSPKRAEAAPRPVNAPTLVIWGQRDRYLGDELAEPDHDECPTSTASSASPTPRIGFITTSTSASASCSPTSSPGPASHELTGTLTAPGPRVEIAALLALAGAAGMCYPTSAEFGAGKAVGRNSNDVRSFTGIARSDILGQALGASERVASGWSWPIAA